MTSTTAQFEKVMDLTPHLGDKVITDCALAYDGRLLLLAVTADDYGHVTGRSENYFQIVNERGYDATFLACAPDQVSRVEVHGIKHAFPHIQIFPDQSILVASSRCGRIDNEFKKNATVFSKDGQLQRQFSLGDAIENLQISKSGEIWVGYFDEGIFGGSIARAGLCCLDGNGVLTWSYEPPSGFDMICDCYAMSADGDTVWMCYYNEFPIVRIGEDKSVTAWRNEVAGARSIITDGERVLLYGGYRPNQHRCVLQDLGSEKTERSRNIELDLTDGLDDAVIIGRGCELHAISNENVWYRWSMKSL